MTTPFQRSPTDHDARIWRYMDFAKFVWLLECRALYFARADRLEDDHEGSAPLVNIQKRPALYGESPAHQAIQRAQMNHWIRQWTFINCWHASEHESAAMWRLYSAGDEAVAIQSSYGRLTECLPEMAVPGLVNYIDYDTDEMPEDNTFHPFFHKRKSFEHEREVRAVVQELPVFADENGRMRVDRERVSEEQGKTVPVDLGRLIERVYIAPTSPGWIAELVDRTAKRYGLRSEVVPSSLARKPVY